MSVTYNQLGQWSLANPLSKGQEIMNPVMSSKTLASKPKSQDSINPSIKKQKKSNKPEAPKAPKPNFKGPASKKDPVKQAQQLKDPSDKKQGLVDAQAERLKYNKLGQWKLDKSENRCWDGYEPTPNKKPYEKSSCRKK